MGFEEIFAYLTDAFPQVFRDEAIALLAAADGASTLGLTPSDKHLRPGGIISGPTLMTLADAAAYAALLTLGAHAKMAVTANLSITFVRAARRDEPIRQHARVIKPGRRLPVVVTEAFGAGGTLLAHATMTYAVPTTDKSAR